MAVSIIAATATIIVSVITLIVGKYFERKRIIEQELRNKKIPIYEEFIELWFKVLWGEKKRKPISEVEMQEFFIIFTQKLLVWGSDEVVKKWSSYRRKFTNTEGKTPPEVMFEFEELLLTIRKDMGHKNKNLEKGILLGLFINDIEEYIPQAKKDI